MATFYENRYFCNLFSFLSIFEYMKKDIQNQIREFADMLPVVNEPCIKKVLGSELLKENKNATDADGKPIIANLIYSLPAVIPRNHYRTMKKIYNKEGKDGLMRYAEKMGKLKKEKVTAN